MVAVQLFFQKAVLLKAAEDPEQVAVAEAQDGGGVGEGLAEDAAGGFLQQVGGKALLPGAQGGGMIRFLSIPLTVARIGQVAGVLVVLVGVGLALFLWKKGRRGD